MPTSEADNATAGDGTGVAGDGAAGTDEDDHDPAQITVNQTFDLALTKTTGSTMVSLGQDVSYTITVINQGTLDATNIQVSDYIPTGMSLNDGNWSETGGIATLNTPIASLAAGQQTTVTIILNVDSDYMGTSLVNYAEISAATNALSQADIDSTPDADDTNDAGGQPDSPADDETAGDGTGTPGDGVAGTDEDDHDSE
ncbi:MAG: DUF11 domain-containing protein, partial [Sulfitobacter sp.]|nr:DUF11 domain-containing protein [Sulfitobacter sp.]